MKKEHGIYFKYSLILLVITLTFILPKAFFAKDDHKKLVYIIPIENEVERGLEAFLIRSTKEAVDAGANHIIFEIDTPGGRVDSASQIGKLLQSIEVETTSYIVNEALSAGSYIALNTKNIYMNKNATMGASGVITGDGNAADKKAQSAWIAAMKSAAEASGRDPLYAEAMADESIDLKELGAPKGEFLTLSPSEALEVGYSEGIVQNRVELLSQLNLSNSKVVETSTTLAEEVARFITSPIVIPILLSIASLGFVAELYTPGFGIAGTMGITALILFFYGHFIAGLAGFEVIVMFGVGIALIISELFFTSGILGIIGGISVLISLILAGYDFTQMALSIMIALIVAIVAAVYFYKNLEKKDGLFSKLILQDQATKDKGYHSSLSKESYLGKKGITLTPLRPSGSAEIEGERVDVITQGELIEPNVTIRVIEVEGVRVVVKKEEV